MHISADEVRYVAALARLELDESEVEAMTGQLDRILGYVAKLNELDTAGVPPASHAMAVHNAFREDAVSPSLPREEALANGPQHDAECFVVPRVL